MSGEKQPASDIPATVSKVEEDEQRALREVKDDNKDVPRTVIEEVHKPDKTPEEEKDEACRAKYRKLAREQKMQKRRLKVSTKSKKKENNWEATDKRDQLLTFRKQVKVKDDELPIVPNLPEFQTDEKPETS